MRKIVSLFLSSLLLFPPYAFSQEDTSERLANELANSVESSDSIEDVPDRDFYLDLRIRVLDEGMEAPFDGILLTSDALTKIKFDYEEQIALMKNDAEFAKQKFNLEMQAALQTWQTEKNLYSTELNLKRNYIEELEAKVLDSEDNTPLYIFGSFVLGSVTAIAITYALTGATK